MRPTLFDFAGGEAAFLALAEAHHVRCLEDPELNHPFSHDDQHPQRVERLAGYWAEVMGGPPAYSQSCGDQSAVLQMHAGNGDMGDLGERFLGCFVRAMDDAALPEDPAFRAAMSAYMRWAVDDVLSYSAEDAVVAPNAGMPRWGGTACSGSCQAWASSPTTLSNALLQPDSARGISSSRHTIVTSSSSSVRSPPRSLKVRTVYWLSIIGLSMSFSAEARRSFGVTSSKVSSDGYSVPSGAMERPSSL